MRKSDKKEATEVLFVPRISIKKDGITFPTEIATVVSVEMNSYLFSRRVILKIFFPS
ncbi:MAG TPA: hypothetical protein VFD10_01395 [Atribacterota bacterium]|nr:hypothetical protein [Atribacterota bacterium]